MGGCATKPKDLNEADVPLPEEKGAEESVVVEGKTEEDNKHQSLGNLFQSEVKDSIDAAEKTEDPKEEALAEAKVEDETKPAKTETNEKESEPKDENLEKTIEADDNTAEEISPEEEQSDASANEEPELPVSTAEEAS